VLLPSEAQATPKQKGQTMTKKDYERIASALRSYREEIEATGATMETRNRLDTMDDVVEILTDVFTELNPRFTPHRFRQACR
jgi:hypothetical protein